MIAKGYVLADDGIDGSGSEITGSGTTGQVVVFTSASSIGNPTIAFTSSAAGFTIGLNTTETSALFSLSSTTTGFLPPRVTTVQRDAIATPIAGLMVYSSAANTYSIYNNFNGTPNWAYIINSAHLPETYTIGDLLCASGTNTLALLPDVASGSLFVSGGSGVAPAWSASPSVTTSFTSPILYTEDIISSLTNAIGISIVSTTTGSVTIDSGTTGPIGIGTEAYSKNISIGNSTGATTLNFISNGTTFTLTNGNFTLTSGTGSISIGTDAAIHVTQIGSVTSTSTTHIQGGTNGINIGTSAVAQQLTIGNVTGATAIVINSGTGGDVWTTTNANWRLFTGTGALNIGTDAADHTITIGDSTGAAAISLNAGTSGVNVGTNAIEHIITIGNITGASRVITNTGTAGSTWTTTNASWTLVTGTSTININSDNTINTINIATGAAAKTLNIGSASGSLIGFFSAAIARPTTAGAAATFVANTSGIANDTARLDSYKVGQIVKALRNFKILA